jgi:isopentenyl diphosphate isomerase/L-lactate dehydrogenase-like FMN-dependent dehydrogenase
VPEAARWFQLYVCNDGGVSRELVARAEESGCEALVVTVELPVPGPRERELRAPICSALALAGAGRVADLDRGFVGPAPWA